MQTPVAGPEDRLARIGTRLGGLIARAGILVTAAYPPD
jgi:hypothetical protein